MNQISPGELERIERFITGRMPEAEATAFKNELLTDVQLQQKTDEIKLLLLGIQEQSLKEQLNRFDTATANPASAKQGSLFFLGKRLLLAASILLIVCLGGWWLMMQKSSEEKIYSRFYKPDPGLPTVMGTAEDYDFEKAMVEYKNKEYDKAITAWNALLKQKPGNDSLLYFTGVAYQANDDNDHAIKNLLPVTENIQSVFHKEACWYLGLCWLKKNDKSRAIEYINRSEHPQREAILNAINKK